MSGRLPQAKPIKVYKALLKLGFLEVRRRGIHRDLHHSDCRRTTVPIHPRPLFKGTLHKILKQTELTIEELKKLL